MLDLVFKIVSIAIIYKIFEPILGGDIWWLYLAVFLWEVKVVINFNN